MAEQKVQWEIVQHNDEVSLDTNAATPAGIVSFTLSAVEWLKGVRLMFDRSDLGNLVGVSGTTEALALNDGVLRHILGDELPDFAPSSGTVETLPPTPLMKRRYEALGSLALVFRLAGSFRDDDGVWQYESQQIFESLSEDEAGLTEKFSDLLAQAYLFSPAPRLEDGSTEWSWPIIQAGAANWQRSATKPTPDLEPSSSQDVKNALPHDPAGWISRILRRGNDMDYFEVATSITESWAILAVEAGRRACGEVVAGVCPAIPDSEWAQASALWWQAATAAWRTLEEEGDEWAAACRGVSEQRYMEAALLALGDPVPTGLQTYKGPIFSWEKDLVHQTLLKCVEPARYAQDIKWLSSPVADEEGDPVYTQALRKWRSGSEGLVVKAPDHPPVPYVVDPVFADESVLVLADRVDGDPRKVTITSMADHPFWFDQVDRVQSVIEWTERFINLRDQIEGREREAKALARLAQELGGPLAGEYVPYDDGLAERFRVAARELISLGVERIDGPCMFQSSIPKARLELGNS